MKTIRIAIFVLIILIIAFIYAQKAWAPAATAPVVAPTATTTKPVAQAGERCGGNMTTAATCAAGYHCAPAPGSHLPFGDVGGICVSD